MIRNPWLKLGIVLVCTILLHAQEQPAPNPQSIQPEVVDAVPGVPVPADTPNANEVKPSAPSTPEDIVQVAPTVVEPIVQTPPQAVQPAATQNAEPQPQTNQNPVPTQSSNPPEVAPVPAQDPPATSTGLQNLTEQQKKQLLHQQSIRAQLHANDSLKLSDLANMTAQQQMQMEKRFAEESRLAYEQAMKQLEARRERERAQYEQLMREQKLSYSQNLEHTQKQRIEKAYQPDVKGTPRFANQYLFDMQPDTTEEFMISIPVAQKVGFMAIIYTNQDGVYVKNKILDNDRPMNIYISENNDRAVYQSSFYFMEGRPFEGSADSTYTFKFENQDKHRLIAFKVTGVLEKAQIQTKLKADDLMSHASRSEDLFTSVRDRLYGLNQETIVQTSNKKKLAEGIRTYYIYNCFEIIIFIVTVLVQIEMIRRLLASSSIV